MDFKIECYKGMGETDKVVISESEVSDLKNKKISDLRSILEKKVVNGQNFIVADDSAHAYRFVMPTADIGSGFQDRIIAKGTEKAINLSGIFLNAYNQIALTNTAKEKRTDLIGYETEWWTGGNLRVRCKLKQSTAEAKEANKKAGVFEPFMLTDVISTNEDLPLSYNNVCVACEDSVVEFPLRCLGTVGFWFNVRLSSGKSLLESGVHWNIGDKNLYGETCVNHMNENGVEKNIVVAKISNVPDIDPKLGLKYQKIEFHATDLIAWKDWDHNKIYNETSHAMIAQTNNMLVGASINAFVGSSSQTIIYGPDIDPATLTPGSSTTVTYGKWWYDKLKPWEQSLDKLSIYLFAFKDLKTAYRYFDKFNILSDKKQADIWK